MQFSFLIVVRILKEHKKDFFFSNELHVIYRKLILIKLKHKLFKNNLKN